MRRWSNSLSFVRSPGRLASRATCVQRLGALRHTRLLSTDTGKHQKQPSDLHTVSPRFTVFDRIERPTRKAAASPDEWVALLEPALPPHLRSPQHVHHEVTLSGIDVSEILLSAQDLRSTSIGFDLLHYLGFEKQRWPAVVYLVKLMIDTFDANPQDLLTPSLWHWNTTASLDILTEHPIRRHTLISHYTKVLPPLKNTALSQLTSDDGNQSLGSTKDLRREALGQVWSSLGHMIISCVDDGGVVYPEILEMIAYLHHHGWMPDAIYSHTPNSDPATVQQSPILTMCSSRILTSLSDAAWKGHAKSLTEDAQSADGYSTETRRPELASSSYRVNVAGLRPEVWLELILWASLHGGWIAEGVHVMRLMIAERKGWKPLSWRALVSSDQARSIEWNELGHIFNTQPPRKGRELGENVHKTVSSELVNAYVDALITSFGLNDKKDSNSIDRTLAQLQVLRRFLDRSSLLLGVGSWDAAIIRLLDYVGEDAVKSSHLSERLLSLSSNFAGGLQSSDADTLPSYVLDGSAAVLGLYHNSFQNQISSGNLHGALTVLRNLQSYTDANKRISVNAFFQSIAAKPRASDRASKNDLFTSSYSGISFPAFDPKIPPSTLGAFLDLITDYKEYDLGRWLLYSDAVDGPLIPKELYNDPIISPAIIRFAIATKDQELLVTSANFRERASSGRPSMSRDMLHSYIDTQISLRRWDAALSLLNYMKTVIKVEWTSSNLVTLTRVMLSVHVGRNEMLQDNKGELERAKQIFADMITGEYNIGKQRHMQSGPRLLVAILCSLDSYWADFCLGLQEVNLTSYIQLPADTRLFNTILEIAVSHYGSRAGRQLLDTFWSPLIQEAQRKRQSGERVNILETVQRQRTELLFRLPTRRSIAILGGLAPNIRTIMIIFAQAAIEFVNDLEDRTASDTQKLARDESAPSPRETVLWAMKVLLDLGLREAELRQEIRSRLSDAQIRALGPEYEAIFKDHSSSSLT